MELMLHTLFFVLGSGLVTLHILTLLATHGGPCKLLQQLRCCLQKPEKDSRIAAEVKKRMRTWQSDQLRITTKVVALIYFYLVAAFLTSGLLSLNTMTTAELACVFFGYSSVLLPLLFPKAMSARSMDAWLLLFALPVIIVMTQAFCENERCAQSPLRLLIAALQIGRLDGRVAGALGAVWLAAGLNAKATNSADVLVAASCTLFSEFFARRGREQLQRAVETEFLQRRQLAFRALLGNFYDVVLELDTDLRIVGPARELAIFLLYGAQTSLEGREFLQFMQQEDREAAAQRLQNGSDGCKTEGSMADVVHVRMRGVDCCAVSAELFCYGFECPGEGGGSFIVGIREFGEEHCAQKGSLPDVCALASIPASVPELEEEEEEIAVVVDTADPKMPMLSMSAGFQLLMGSAPQGAGLMERLCDGRSVGAWVQVSMNRWLSEGPGEACHKVKFKAMGGVQIRALCSFSAVEHEGDLVARLVFSQVEQRRRRRSRGSSRGSSRACISPLILLPEGRVRL